MNECIVNKYELAHIKYYTILPTYLPTYLLLFIFIDRSLSPAPAASVPLRSCLAMSSSKKLSICRFLVPVAAVAVVVVEDSFSSLFCVSKTYNMKLDQLKVHSI